MSNKDLSQFLPADLFLKSAVVEKNPDMSFREAVAEFFGVSPEEITRIRRTKDAKGWDITIEGMYEPSQEEEDYQWDLGPEEYGDEEDSEEEDYQEYVKGIKKFIYDYSDYIPDAEKLKIVLQALDTDSAESSEAVGPAMKTIKHFLSEYDYSLPDQAIAFLKDCLDILSDIDLELQDWEREGDRNEIAYQNRWRDYTEPEEEMDDAEEDYRRDPYSPWNY